MLEPTPHAFAIWLPDGTRATWQRVRDAATGRVPPFAHHRHSQAEGYGCLPAAGAVDVEQLALFGEQQPRRSEVRTNQRAG